MKPTQSLNHFVDSIIRENKIHDRDGYKLDIDNLSNSDKEDFAAHLIEYDSFNKEGWYFLLEDVYREELASIFASYILSYGNQKEILKDGLLEGLKKSAIKAYQERMQTLINERIKYVYQDDEWERMHPSDTDDYIYRKASSL